MRMRSTRFYARLVSVLLGATLIGSLVVGHHAIETVRVGGPAYDRIINDKDLVADVLPPPLYIIEAYLDVNVVLNNPGELARIQSDLAKLRRDYDERHAYWTRKDVDSEVKAALLIGAHKPAETFWSLVLDRFMPALARGDTAAARAVFPAITAAYADHRQKVEALVTLANQSSARTEQATEASVTFNLTLLGSLGLLVLVMMVGCAVLLETHLVGPIARFAAALRDLAKGGDGRGAPESGRTRELVDMGEAVEAFRQNAAERRTLVDDISRARTEAETGRSRLEELAFKFMRDSDQIKIMLDREAHVVRNCANAFRTTVSTTEREASAGLNSSTAAAESVGSVANATDELSQSTHRIAAQAVNAQRLTEKAADGARAAEQDVQRLARVTSEIGAFLDTITGIAGQTNLLSLNATIEASRAGEAGRGFAVVAAEVKALASETAKAASSVARLLQDIEQCSGTVVTSISQISDAVQTVRQLNDEIAAATVRQSETTAQIASGATRAAESTRDAHETSAKVSDIVHGARREVDLVEQASGSLFELVQEFSSGIDAFLGTISDDMKDRRSLVRHRVDREIEATIAGRRTRVMLRDVSLTGGSLGVTAGLAVDGPITLHMPGIDVAGRCVWVDASGVGVHFDRKLQDLPVAFLTAAAA
ncbi:methyl-accepting chemotaxis protein [Prosthecodimorpha staleyi]|uniref:PilZ domain-containing protein n=1 Tax=Prosthecodimorpha staleyi TaxID=2840188 RepID=A0A947GAL4_9HYPH|nr:methyl-accepting chemotaxis protein [Prosthecodimorpha staleyi]MBT9289248.1 PilZ domain-containing protein [Prosthecodimorpha staleyi]